jgi:hypothetical protein
MVLLLHQSNPALLRLRVLSPRQREISFFRRCTPGAYVVLLTLALIFFGPRIEGDTTALSQQVIAGIDNAQMCREQRLKAYTASEKYIVRNSHFEEPAELTAIVTYQRGTGKTYRIVSRTGNAFLQKRVLDRVLKEDAELSRDSERAHSLLTSANYAMNVEGTEVFHGEPCYIIGIHPRVHSLSGIEGKAWIDKQDFSLLRIQGRPTASPSFWTGRPLIEREYAVINGLSFAQHSRATSKGFFAGKSELDIEYSDYALTLFPK